MLTLNTIKAQPGATHKRKRLGRGSGSGHGPTAGKGDKGQLQRSGGHSRPGFEGGQMPLYRRLPKRGFSNSGRRSTAIINLCDLELLKITEISLETLNEVREIRGRFDRLAVLGTGEIKRAITVKAHRISSSAVAKIEKAGGKVELIPIPAEQPRVDKKKIARAAQLAAKKK